MRTKIYGDTLLEIAKELVKETKLTATPVRHEVRRLLMFYVTEKTLILAAMKDELMLERLAEALAAMYMSKSAPMALEKAADVCNELERMFDEIAAAIQGYIRETLFKD